MHQLWNEPPTSEHPLLVGLLIDVSISMNNALGPPDSARPRLESVRDALDDLVHQARESSSRGDDQVLPLIRVFAYGFGFGGPLERARAWLARAEQPETVRDLLKLPGAPSSCVPIDALATKWSTYKQHVEAMTDSMGGDTPMLKALEIARQRFEAEARGLAPAGQPLLFLISDGEPTDIEGQPQRVVSAAGDLKADGVLILSCYLTDRQVGEPKRLYAEAPRDWPPEPGLMLQCASELPDNTPLAGYFAEDRWTIDPGARMFSQVNHPATLSWFIRAVLSPLRRARATASQASSQARVRVFVSYTRQDRKFLEDTSLLGFLKSLEREGFEFWYDTRLRAGDLWDHEIQCQLNRADIALVLVSQAFLRSKFCMNREVELFLKRRRDDGLVIFPILLSPCDWQSHTWLAETQSEPRDGRSITRHYRDPGARAEQFTRILEQLRGVGQQVRPELAGVDAQT